MYEYVSDILERRSPYRAAHLQMAWEAHSRGELVLAGALADPVDGGVLLFRCESESTVADFAKYDPYVLAGLVTKWTIRKWLTVVGNDAITPIRP